MSNSQNLGFLNSLDGQERSALQVAALIGNSFSLDQVLEITNIKPSKLLGLINKMIQQKVIKEKSGFPKGAYYFRQKLSIFIIESMDKDKKQLYLIDIIEYMEREPPANDEKKIFLANLFLKLNELEDRFCYIKKAADLLTSAHKTEEALLLYKKIIDILSLKENKNSSDYVILLDSVLSYAPIAINRCLPEEISPILNNALNIAQSLGNERTRAMIQICMGRLFQVQGNIQEASIHYDEGWQIANSIKDEEVIKASSKLVALSLFWKGQILEAIEIYERTLGNLEEISPDLRDLWAYLMLAYCYGLSGRIARGIGLAEAIRGRAESKGYQKTKGFAAAVIALILLEVRRLKEAESYIDEAIHIGEKVDGDLVLWMANPCKAFLLYEKGDLKGAKSLSDSGFSIAKKLGQIHYPSPWYLELLWTFHKMKLEPVGGYTFFSEISRLLDWPDIYMRGAALRYYALSKKQVSGANFKEIEQLLQESRRLLKKAGALVELGRTELELARLYIENHKRGLAKKLANIAYQNLSQIDTSLYPSDLLPLVNNDIREIHIYQGVSDLKEAVSLLPNTSKYLSKAITILTEMFGAERVAIFSTVGEDSNSFFKLVATRNFAPEELEQYNKRFLRKLMLSTIGNKEPLIIPGFQVKPDLIEADEDNFPTIRSLALIPLVAGNKSVGLIYMDNRLIKEMFSQKDLTIMMAVATQITLVMDPSLILGEAYNLPYSPQKEIVYSNKIEKDSVIPKIVGKSEAINNILITVKKVAETGATVLLLGETGVGKELIAQSIHNLSKRANRPFISVNIPALTENLLSSELFGYEKGAFTGAVTSTPGRFELADGGTIFLDEIGDLSMEAQVKLLRVLQEKKFQRVGGTKTIYSDFRLIAATNKELSQQVTKGAFRTDLYYRLSTFPIEIPPLRERKEDIPDLVLHFINKYVSENQKSCIKKISKAEMKKLLEHSWPGNIRELEHVIEKAVILCEGESLLIPEFSEHRSYSFSPKVPSEDKNQEDLLELSEIERRHILKVLNQVKWRIRGEKGAARVLGLKPSTLEYRMKKMSIKICQ